MTLPAVYDFGIGGNAKQKFLMFFCSGDVEQGFNNSNCGLKNGITSTSNSRGRAEFRREAKMVSEADSR